MFSLIALKCVSSFAPVGQKLGRLVRHDRKAQLETGCHAGWIARLAGDSEYFHNFPKSRSANPRRRGVQIKDPLGVRSRRSGSQAYSKSPFVHPFPTRACFSCCFRTWNPRPTRGRNRLACSPKVRNSPGSTRSALAPLTAVVRRSIASLGTETWRTSRLRKFFDTKTGPWATSAGFPLG